MSHRFRSAVVALSTAALLSGVIATPAQAQSEVPAPQFTTEMLSSVLPEPIQSALWLLFAVPVIGSSILSSAIGIPQCGLHDTRAY